MLQFRQQAGLVSLFYNPHQPVNVMSDIRPDVKVKLMRFQVLKCGDCKLTILQGIM
jgi:hypothetical protein